MGAHITLYATPGTPEHRWATHALQRTGHPHRVIDPAADDAAQAHLNALGYDGPPVIQVGNRHWPGNDPAAIGKLIEYLGKPPSA